MSNFLCAPPNIPVTLYQTCGNVTGGPPGQPDPSTGGGSWSSFTAGHLQHHQLQSAAALNGSREPNCCAIVCSVNYLCCSIAWDADCAASALTVPDCYITRDYFADLIDVDVTNAQTTAATANRSIYALNPAFQAAAGQPTGVSSFDQGNPYDPTTLATPYYGDSLLLLGETFGATAPAQFPLAASATITQPELSPGLDGVSGLVEAGSMPLALWGTRLRQLPPPGSATASSIFPQCGQVTPPAVSTDPKWGDTGAEDTGIASVRGFPDLRVMALEVKTGEWFDPSNDASVELITGKEISQPNPYAISAVDDFYLKARSIRARGSSGGFGPSVPYVLPNRVVDVQVARNTGFGSPDEALKINVEGNTTILGSGLTLAMVFVYNSVTNRWELWLPEDDQIQVLPGGVATPWVVQSPGCSPASAYVVSDQGELKVFTRVVTMAGGTGANYQCWHDQIKVQINAVGGLYTVGDCGGAAGQP